MMVSKKLYIAALVCVSFLSLWPRSAQAQFNDLSLCQNSGYTVGFFNGVWNTPTTSDAYGGVLALSSLIGPVYAGEPVDFELFYNHTGTTVGATGMQDLVETFMQRAREIDESGALEQRFEFFWEVLAGKEFTFWERLQLVHPSIEGARDALKEELLAKMTQGLGGMLSSPPTLADRQEHAARLEERVLQGKKILMVAHSQGNLFLNSAYDYISAKADVDSVKAVHIAPASTSTRGPHILADIDLIINGLRLTWGNVPAVNLNLPFSAADLSGHTLVGTYLDGARKGPGVVLGAALSAMDELVTPTALASDGFFTATLTWDGAGDVDLHTYEPYGAHVYYYQPDGESGLLDVDNRVAVGPEHYFASCYADQLQVGSYFIGINHYEEAEGRVATIQIASSKQGVLATKSLSVGAARRGDGDYDPIIVFQVSVLVDEENNYSVVVNEIP